MFNTVRSPIDEIIPILGRLNILLNIFEKVEASKKVVDNGGEHVSSRR